MQTKIKKSAHLVILWISGIALMAALGLAAYLVWQAAVAAGVIPSYTNKPPATTGPTKPPFVDSSTIQITGPQLTPNPYGPDDFTQENGYIQCVGGKAVMGIDVSTFQRGIDWKKVKEAGVEFVMIRAAYRGTNIGVIFEDEDAQKHYQGAKAAGLKIGAYIFSQAITPDEAVEEAEYLLEVTKDWELDMPLVFDWEHIDDDCRTVGMDARTLTDSAKAFCQRIKLAGKRPMIYFNVNQALKLILLRELTEYEFWLAMYDSEMDFPIRIDMWQYTQTGKIPGIPTNVDINLYFPYEEENPV